MSVLSLIMDAAALLNLRSKLAVLQNQGALATDQFTLVKICPPVAWMRYSPVDAGYDGRPLKVYAGNALDERLMADDKYRDTGNKQADCIPA